AGGPAALALAAYALLLGGVNLAWGARPVADAETNADLMKTRWLREAVPPDAWVTAVSIEEVYFPYFDHLHTLDLRWYEGRVGALRDKVGELLAAGTPVYVTSDHLAAGWADAFAPFKRVEAGTWRGVTLYRLRNGKPNGSR
ncbi:MAG: hypothetical protein KGL53_03230, partial [Elusimicrobia bacterium]|nr:hypothetical protein [Elusimicrobiota bacterium]